MDRERHDRVDRLDIGRSSGVNDGLEPERTKDCRSGVLGGDGSALLCDDEDVFRKSGLRSPDTNTLWLTSPRFIVVCVLCTAS